MQPDEFHELKRSHSEAIENNDIPDLVMDLVYCLENDESFTSNGAKALSIAYELNSRIGPKADALVVPIEVGDGDIFHS